MKNIYDGVAVFDGAGEAIITLPDWFEALNRDFRDQLTPMGAAFVPYMADEIAGKQFKIGGGITVGKVSWQVTGIRRDAFANAKPYKSRGNEASWGGGGALASRSIRTSGRKGTIHDRRVRL